MGELIRSTTSIRIFGKNLNPDELTHLLGSQPTKAQKRGEVITNSNGETRVAKKGCWLISYDGDDEVELEIKIESLLNKLTDDFQIWERITREYKVDIFCGLFLESFNEGYELSARLLKKMGERNLKIGFDIYLP